MADDVLTLEKLTALTPDVLKDYDIALLNLSAAHGLPGTEELDVNALLNTLDEWAERVQLEIWRHIYRFDRQVFQPPTEFRYGNSLGRFFCWYLLQVLQEDCGVAYHPDRKYNPDFCQPEDLFIHGMINEEGRGGTCASMPVLYVAVGRRIGLPVYLVEARGHLFFRWDAPHGTTIHWDRHGLHLWIPPDRFNVEGSGEGIAYYPDSHYVQWPELWQEADFNHGRYLRSLTPAEDAAAFLIQRAECFHELRNWEECLKAIYYARKFSPDDERYKWLHAKRTKEFQAYEQSRIDSIQEMDAWQREQRAKAKPAIPGHPLECRCWHCQQVRQIEQSRPNNDHGPSCRCWHCEKLRALKQSEPQSFPGHGPSCECHHCRTARESAKASIGLPGHLPTCQCGGCLHQRRIHSQLTPGFFPGHAMPQFPAAHDPHQPFIAQPKPLGLPGT